MNKALEKLGILDIFSFPSEDLWYEYLLNDYIPNKRPQDMGIFIELGFSPYNYIIYRLATEGHLNPEFKEAVISKCNKIREAGS